MANSFAQDGAFGAGGPAQSTAPTPGAFGTTPAATTSPAASGAASASYGMPQGGGWALDAAGGGSWVNNSTGNTYNQNTGDYSEGNPGGGSSAPSSGGGLGGTPAASNPAGSGNGGGNVPMAGGGIFFDAGGSVPDDNGQSQQQDPMSATLQQSLGSASQALQMVYKQFGLGGDQAQTGGVQEAANMPTVPGGQSETGIPPQRPGPGTLPPTSNPFGKRAGIQDDETQEAA